MGNRTKLAAGIAAGYLLLLTALTLSERTDPTAGIRTFWDAAWYSLVTLTTVGYGDLYPVTPAGKAISLLFLAGSLGLLAAVAAAAFTLLRDSLWPRVRLSRLRGKPIYLFSEENEASATLGARLAEEDGDARILFCGADPNGAAAPGRNITRWWMSLPELLRMESGSLNVRGIFLMATDVERNRETAPVACGRGCAVYCMVPEAEAPSGVQTFDPAECAARMYWHRHPLARGEKEILIIGAGRTAQRLLEQAIQVNCRIPYENSEYHLFGPWEAYRRWHPAFEEHLFRQESPEQDRFRFHDEDGAPDPDLLRRADRIIFCADEPSRNLSDACRTVSLFPVRGRVDAFGCRMPEGIGSFGTPGEIFTPETVMRTEQDRAARAMHARYCRKNGKELPWESLTEFQRNSNRAAADHLQTKLALLTEAEESGLPSAERAARAMKRFSEAQGAEREKARRCEHERWMRFHWRYNWRYGEEKSEKKRTHPSLRAYGELSAGEQAKDDYAWENLLIFQEGESKE